MALLFTKFAGTEKADNLYAAGMNLYLLQFIFEDFQFSGNFDILL